MRKRNAHVWEKHPDNWYVEPGWCVEALLDREGFAGTIHDPCCGIGTIPLAARRAGYPVTASDITDRGFADCVQVSYKDDTRMHDNIITNPPFDDVNKKPWPFLDWAMTHARWKVALLVPFKWFGGARRSEFLQTLPLYAIYVLAPRPSMPPGNVLEEMLARGEKPQGGREDFAWAIFHTSGHRMKTNRPLLSWIYRNDKTAV